MKTDLRTQKERHAPGMEAWRESIPPELSDGGTFPEGDAGKGVAIPDAIELMVLTSPTPKERNRHGKIHTLHSAAPGFGLGADLETQGVADDRVVGSTNSRSRVPLSFDRRVARASNSSLDRSCVSACNAKTWNSIERNSADDRCSRQRRAHDWISSRSLTDVHADLDTSSVNLGSGSLISVVLISPNPAGNTRMDSGTLNSFWSPLISSGLSCLCAEYFVAQSDKRLAVAPLQVIVFTA